MGVIQDFKDKNLKYISDEQMIQLLDMLSYLRNKAFIILYEQAVIIGGQKYKELLGYYISNVGHKQASVFIAGYCDSSAEYQILRPYELVFHLSDISHMKENGKWMVSPIMDADNLPMTIIACEAVEFDY